MSVPYLELDKETKDIKMQVLHGWRHRLINGGKSMVLWFRFKVPPKTPKMGFCKVIGLGGL